VMYLGKIAEVSAGDDLYSYPLHPYTQALLKAVHVPNPHLERSRARTPLSGDLPNPAHPPLGCNFSTRCPLAQEICRQSKPELRQLRPDHWVACHLL
jgi:oligopeptide/dipeptide ABC transporter ATP-binding protein